MYISTTQFLIGGPSSWKNPFFFSKKIYSNQPWWTPWYHLLQDVLFGLLRLGFGEGRLRRTKYVFIHAIGDRVPAVTRGRLSAQRPQMEEIMGNSVFGQGTVIYFFNLPYNQHRLSQNGWENDFPFLLLYYLSVARDKLKILEAQYVLGMIFNQMLDLLYVLWID